MDVTEIPSGGHPARLRVAEDWDDEVRNTFHQLYVVEDKPLPQVMDEIREKLGFVATERQYKRKITAWHLDKNIKDEEMRAIIHWQERRKTAEDKESMFCVRGRLVDPKKIQRFAQRKRISPNPSSVNLVALPPDIRCCTPIASGSQNGESSKQQASRKRQNKSDTSIAELEKELRSLRSQLVAQGTLRLGVAKDGASLDEGDTSRLNSVNGCDNHVECTGPESVAEESNHESETQERSRIQSIGASRSPSRSNESSERKRRKIIDGESSHGSLQTETPAQLVPGDARSNHDESLLRHKPSDLRRLSVYSLLMDSPTVSARSPSPKPADDSNALYGLDGGFPDLDLPRHDDLKALQGASPSSSSDIVNELGTALAHVPHWDRSDVTGSARMGSTQRRGGYYAEPVPVKIPKILQPLPSILIESPMNMLYFHHFVNHTAGILAAHDCAANPFRSILPQMACHDGNLLRLLLAYSASHRARLLMHPAPTNRIALWVQTVFPALQQALNDIHPLAPNFHLHLATVLMLTSLEIISSDVFEVPISWQSHLNIARRMFLARGGAQAFDCEDKVGFFLVRWFARLDVFGRLSSEATDPLPTYEDIYWIGDNVEGVDCMLGMNPIHLTIYKKIAGLRSQASTSESRPSSSAQILDYIQRTQQDNITCCSTSKHEFSNSYELIRINQVFHLASIIALQTSGVGDWQALSLITSYAIHQIIDTLISMEMQSGGTAESCLIFPIFIAGCVSESSRDRAFFSDKLRSMQDSGMAQVRKARAIMEQVWTEGSSWYDHGQSEFIGQA